jgi:serine/threonine protein kinase/WD40 repeat protein
MDNTAATHPTVKELTAFRLGKLTEAERAVVARHLAVCDACRQAAQRGTVGPSGSSPPPAKGSTLPPSAAAPGAPGETTTSSPSSGLPLARETETSPPSPAPPADVPPELVDHPRYRILRELGRGAMGVVYQAKHRVMERLVAVKVINKTLVEHPEALARFQQEVKAAAALPSHPNIVTAYDAERASDLHLLVMEYVEGWSLAQVLERKGPLPVGYACRCAHQVALGLQHAFEQGMVHRDLKPQNLIVTAKGVVKILDFGLARMASERQRGRRLTQDGAVMGTPEYMAPEQATDARQADIRADIYSLGCTLYCLLAGQPPFVEDTVVKTILAHMDREALSLTELRPDVPPGLAAAVARMMAKEPGQRYQTPAEVVQALAPFLAAKTPVPGPPVVTAAPPVVPPTKSPTLVPAPPPLVPPPEPAESSWTDLATVPAGASLLPVRRTAPATRPQGKRLALWAAVVVLGLAALAGGLYVAGVIGRKPAPPSERGTIVLEVNQPDVIVYVDDEKVTFAKPTEEGPVPIKRPAGSHHVRVAKKGFKDFREQITVPAGGRVSVEVKLERPPGTLVLKDLPDGAKVVVDGKEADVKPGARLELAEGRHLVKVNRPGHREFSRPITIQAGQTEEMSVELLPLPAMLVLTIDPAGAEVLIDGQTKYTAPPNREPLRIPVEAGKREVRVSKDGYHARTETITVDPGEEKAFPLPLRPIMVPVVLTVDPGPAEVFIDGQRVGTAPPDRQPLRFEAAAGTRQLKVSREGYRSDPQSVQVVPGMEKSLTVRLKLIPKEIKDAVRTFDAELKGVKASSQMVVKCVAISPDGQSILFNGGMPYPQGPLGGNEVHLWESGGQAHRLLKGKPVHKFPVTGVAFSPSGTSAISISSTGHSDQWAIWWDLQTGEVAQQEIGKFRGLDGYVVGAFSPKGPILACYRNDSVQLWDPTAKEKGPTVKAVNSVGGAKFLAFAPDLKRVLVGHAGGKLRVWDTATGQDVQTFPGHANQAAWFGVFSADGRRVLSGGPDRNVRVWDMQSGAEVVCLGDHPQEVTCAAFGPDGNHVVSGCKDGIVRWWEVKTGQALAVFKGHTMPITCVAYSPRGDQLVSGSSDKTVRVWALPPK